MEPIALRSSSGLAHGYFIKRKEVSLLGSRAMWRGSNPPRKIRQPPVSDDNGEIASSVSIKLKRSHGFPLRGLINQHSLASPLGNLIMVAPKPVCNGAVLPRFFRSHHEATSLAELPCIANSRFGVLSFGLGALKASRPSAYTVNK
jgi:hypothetical protein